MLAEGLVATNFHVLEAIAPGGQRLDGRFEGRLKTGAAVHFGHEAGNPRPQRRFPIRRVISVGCAGAAEFAQANGLNFDGLDLAILELEPVADARSRCRTAWPGGMTPRRAAGWRARDVVSISSAIRATSIPPRQTCSVALRRREELQAARAGMHHGGVG